MACKVWRVSLECKVWSVACGVHSAQCRGNSKVHLRHRSGPSEAREEVTQRAAKVQDDR